MKYKLKDIALTRMGLPFRSRMEPDAGGNVAVIQMRDLTEDKLDYRTLMTVNINDLNERHLVKYKDLICRSRGQNTTATIIDQEPGRAVVAAPLFLIRATSENVLPEYLCWFINLSSSQAFLHRRATGTAITMIGKSALDALEIPLPNRKTQEQIVKRADLLNKEQRLMRALAEQKEKLVKGYQMRVLLSVAPWLRGSKRKKRSKQFGCDWQLNQKNLKSTGVKQNMNTQIQQKDINNAAWAACDTFRGVMDAAGYKDYILVMLFLKYISDVWREHYAEYKKRYGDNDERIRRRLRNERFVLPDGSSFYSLYDQRSAANIGELINIALEAIETENKQKLEGVFRNIDFNSETNLGRTRDRNRRLKTLLEDFNKPELNMSPRRVSEDVIGNTYIYLIERFASDAGKKAGEFYTPHKVSELVAKLCAPKSGARICDPACGSAGLLIEAARVVGDKNYALYGMEVNGSTWALARMNMFLHGADAARIEWCNTLTAPALVESDRLMKFDNVVANPPFSLNKWGAEDAEADLYNRFWRSLPPKSKGDYAFISHMVEAALEKQGRVAVVVPHGVLFRGGAEGRIRQHLIEENVLDAVIGLPANLFPTTSIPVAILVFDRSREHGGANENREDVLFIDASREYQAGKNQNALLDAHIEKITTTYKKRRDIDKYAHLATFEEIEENDFNLNIPRYVDTFEEEEEIDIDAVQLEIDRLEEELNVVRGEMGRLMQGIRR